MSARRRGLSAFSKTIVRSIRSSLGRFCAIMGIVALGCGFYAGLQMSGPNMRAAADDLYDGTNLYDIRIVSTLGFTSTDVKRVRPLEGVEAVMPAISCDAMARLGNEQLAVRVSSINVDEASESRESGSNAIVSPAANYLNRVFLREGRWPVAADECVITADKNVADVHLGDSVELLYGVADLGDVLRERKLKVVGTVSSSVYPYTGSFGSTTLGSGMIGEYLFVSPEAFVEDAPFTEIFLRVKGAQDLESGSDAYQAAVDVVRGQLDGKVDELAQARLADIRADAQEELDKNRAKYERERKKARRELAKAQKEIADAKAELADGEREVADGERALKDGERTYEESRQKLEDASRSISSSRNELDRGWGELKDGERQWSEGLTSLLNQLGADAGGTTKSARAYVQGKLDELRSGRKQLEGGIAQADAGIAQAKDGIAQLESGIAQANEGIAQATAGLEAIEAGISQAQAKLDQIDAAMAQLPDGAQKKALASQWAEGVQALSGLKAQRSDVRATLFSTGAQRDTMKAQLGDMRTSLAKAQATRQSLQQKLDALPSDEKLLQAISAIDELESSRATLDASKARLEEGEASLRAGIAECEDGKAKLADAKAQLEESRGKLDDAKAELEEGRDKVADGEKEYSKSKAKAKRELADAKRKLDDAQDEIDELEPPELYLLDRSKSEGAMTYDADSRRMDSIADVFPFMFFLVAALVALTTMTRMVDDERIEIGTYKALGYSTARIASKYLVYAGLASVVGATLGVLALSQVLPHIVTSAYSIIYTVPLHPFPLPIHMGIALMSGGLGVGVTLLSTWAAVVATLRETPATLMLPRAPAAGKRILLERVAPVWRRLSFSWKVTCRNLFRYKRRFAMTVIGISGCTALLLVGFGLHDAIWDIIDCQYGPIVHYDTTVGLDEDATQADIKDVMAYLEATGEVSGIVRVQQRNMQVAPTATTIPCRYR